MRLRPLQLLNPYRTDKTKSQRLDIRSYWTRHGSVILEGSRNSSLYFLTPVTAVMTP